MGAAALSTMRSRDQRVGSEAPDSERIVGHTELIRWWLARSRLVFSYEAMWRLLVQTGSRATKKNLRRAGQKSASGSLPSLSRLPARDCRSRHGRVSACSRDTARLSEPMRGQGETEFAQVLRLRDGIAEHRCDASRGEPDS